MDTLNWRYATPEQKNFWDLVKGKIAYTSITPLYYMGVCAGSEFETYNAGKLYVGLEMAVDGCAANATVAILTFYNEANTASFQMMSESGYYTGAAVNYVGNTVQMANVYFGRVVISNYGKIKFNGYRLNT
jgi:hypothetical protein